MDITQFINKVQIEYGVNPVFSDLGENEGLTKIELNVEVEKNTLTWFRVGYNEADANQSVIDKAVKFLKWD